MTTIETSLILRLARSPRDLAAAQRLRYRVFIEELGGDGPMVDHAARLERDDFDALFDHLLLIDPARDDAALDDVVGVYRLLPSDRLGARQFYSEGEFDLTALRTSGRRLLELGRSCVHADYRGGTAMLLLWNGLADYVLERDIEVMFGMASFHGTDLTALRTPLAYLATQHLAPAELRVTAKGLPFRAMNLPAPGARETALASMPALIRAYLRLGGFVGDGVWVDRDFNTTDVCLVMDTAKMSDKHRAFYLRKQERPEGSMPQ